MFENTSVDYRYQYIIENMKDVIWELDKNLIVTYMSPADYRMRGFSADEVIGKHVFTLLTQKSAKYIEVTLSEWLGKLDGGEISPTILYEVEQICKDGRIIITEVSANPIIRGGEFTGLIGSTRDITAKVIDDQKLRDSEENLRTLNEFKDRMFSIIAHDLRGPLGNLSVMIGAISELLESESQELADFIDSSKETAEYSYQLVENLLAWGRGQMGAVRSRPVEFDVKLEVDDTLKIYHAMARKKGIEFFNLIPADLVAFIDIELFSTITRNLISNAIKFTPGGKIIISDQGSSDDILKIGIEDTGIGMDEYALKTVFSKPKHYTTYGTNNEKGSGLGMKVVQDFVEKSGGSIAVTSAPGIGTKFVVTLPHARL